MGVCASPRTNLPSPTELGVSPLFHRSGIGLNRRLRMADDAPSPRDPSSEDPSAQSGRGSPSWEPYQSPGSSTGGVLRALRRYAFSITLVLGALGVGLLLYLSPERLSPDSPPGPSSSADAPTASGSQYATVSVYSVPGGAAVVVDGDTVGTTPLERHRLRSGTHLVSVVKDDYVPLDTAMTLPAEQSTVYTPRLQPRTANQRTAGDQRTAQVRPQSTTEDFGTDPPPERAPDSTPPERNATGASEEQARSGTSSRSSSEPLVTGRLTLRSDPDSVSVSINGYDAGSTPATLTQVAAGTHDITFSHPGHETVTKQAVVRGRDSVMVSASLKALTGHLRVLVRPWGSIFIDGQRRAEDADVWYETEVQAGPHTVTARHPALGEQAQTVEVAPRDTQSVIIDVRQE